MKLLSKTLPVLAALTLMAACAEKYKEPDDDYRKSRLIPVFTLPGQQDAPGRGEVVGVYMYPAGEPLTARSVLADNRQHMLSSTGTLIYTTLQNIIRMPENGDAVDFVAYYPYSTLADGFVLPIDLADASSPKASDLHYAAPARGYNVNNREVPLVFERQLATVSFDISNKVLTGSIQGMSVTIEGVRTRADFDLRTGELIVNPTSTGIIRMRVTPTRSGAVAEAVVIPSAAPENIVVKMRQGTATAEATFTDITFAKAADLTLSVELGEGDPGGSGSDPGPGPGPDPDVYPAWFELPRIETDDNSLWVYHAFTEQGAPTYRNYSLLYDKEYKVAHWVAYPLVPAHFKKNVDRTNAWAYDPKIGNSYQVNLRPGSYTGHWERGHQLPSGDRLFSYNANASTFYSSNIAPQHGGDGGLNGGVWGTLEGRARSWASRTDVDTLYMVTGVVVPDAVTGRVEWTTDKEGTRVAVPRYFYKAIAQLYSDRSVKVAGFWFENQRPPSSSIADYRITITELENRTGITFFPSLPDEVKSTLESSFWN